MQSNESSENSYRSTSEISLLRLNTLLKAAEVLEISRREQSSNLLNNVIRTRSRVERSDAGGETLFHMVSRRKIIEDVAMRKT